MQFVEHFVIHAQVAAGSSSSSHDTRLWSDVVRNISIGNKREIRKKQQEREIADQTNNHLVRHRLLILERLVGDIVKEYAGGDKEHLPIRATETEVGGHFRQGQAIEQLASRPENPDAVPAGDTAQKQPAFRGCADAVRRLEAGLRTLQRCAWARPVRAFLR